jgi:hypothetical protein
MARKRGGLSVYRPRKHGRRFLVELYDGQTGKRERKSFASEEEAWLFHKSALKEIAMIQGPSTGEVMIQYEKFLHQKGNKPASVSSTIQRLTRFFGECQPSFAKFTTGMIEELYANRRANLKADSHRNELAEVKTFFGGL